MNASTAALERLSGWLVKRWGSRLVDTCLFGSTARGEAGEDSDIDVLVVVDALTSEDAREIAHHCGDLLTEFGVMISPFALSSAHFAELRRRERRIIEEIDRDRHPLPARIVP